MADFDVGQKGAAGIANEIGASPKVFELVPTGSDFDVTANATGTSGSRRRIVCRGIMVTDAGAGTKKLDIVNADGSSPIAGGIDCTNLVGVFLPCAVRTIKSTATTTVTRVLVFY